jgi:protein TonB
MRTPSTIAVTVCLLLLALVQSARAQEIKEAQDLYSSAAYEQALTVLDRIREGNVATPEALLTIEQYRAYCLLALNRKGDAQQAIETVYTIDPFFQPSEDEVAPWVRTAFKDVRRRALPAALQRMYAQAKDALDRKAYPEAIQRFKQVLALMDDPDIPADKDTVVDYRPLAQGFLDLAMRAAAAASAPPPAPPTPAAPPEATAAAPQGKPAAQEDTPATQDNTAAAPEGKPAAPASGSVPASTETAKSPAARIYGSADTDVVPPVPIRQDIPRWPASYLPAGSPDGIVEVVVDETGAVESAAIRQSLNKFYDSQLLEAARKWRYQPATKGGQPVKYRRLVRISFAGQ